MKMVSVFHHVHSIRGAAGVRALPFVLAAVIGANVLPTFGYASRIDNKCVLGDGTGAVVSQPWLQNVYTNRFTVMCETKGLVEGLALQYAQGYESSVAMSYEEGLKEGTFVCKAEIVLNGAEGETVPYRLATNNVAIVGTEGSVKLWKDEDKAFSCAIWGDNQEGVQKYDWGLEDTGMRYQCITNMFRHMANQKPDFGFTTGDMSSHADYEKEIVPGELRGANDLFGCRIPYHLVWGNHDCNGTFFGEEYTNAVQRYFAPAATEKDGWFHLYRNDVLFIGVHWTWGQDGAEERYAEIAKGVEDLLKTDRAKNAKFRVLVQHAPIFLEVYNVLPKVNWFGDTRLLDVAKAGGVDVVFSGHTHAYERIERDGLVQVVNGGMGYLDHGERWYNNYGGDTKVGGHQNTPLLWARQSPLGLGSQSPTLNLSEPVRMGCFQGYGMLSVEGNTLTYKAHAFNADGSYIGVADAFSLASKTVRATEKPSTTKGVNIGLDLGRPIDNAAWAEYKSAMGEEFHYDPVHAHDPVVNVSKTEIERFCAALNAGGGHNYRLPTIAELTAIFGGDLRRDVSEWTADVDLNSGWCRILGGNAKAVDHTWCREYDKPAMVSPDCHANYLGFRLVDAATPVAAESMMDKALAALAKIENPGEVCVWSQIKRKLVDVTDDWTNATRTTRLVYAFPVIFTGKGDLRYRVRSEVVFNGGLAVPNAKSLDLSHVLDLGQVSKPVTVKGDFRGGVAADEWRFYLKCDKLTLDNVKYRGQVFNAVTDDRTLNLVGTNDFSGAVMSVGIDSLVKDPHEKFVTKLVAAEGDAMLWLRRLDFTNRNVLEEVIGRNAASFDIGENVTLVTTEDVLFGIKGATLTVDGALDAAGVNIAGHLLGLLPQEATVTGSGKLTTTHFGMCDKSTLNIGVSSVTTLSSVPQRTYSDCADGCNVNYFQREPNYALTSGKDWLFNHAIVGKECPDEAAADSLVDLFFVYPTLAGGERIVVDGFRGIDDATARLAVTNYSTAVGSYSITARCFADMTHVYAPYYRQATLDTAYRCSTNAAGEVAADANARYLQTLYEGPAYADVTNALTTYFAKWNNGRKLVFASHSQGSALLRLVMENYFTLPENQDKAKLIVCSYQIGFGIGESSMDKIKKATGVSFAAKADDTNVIVSYNTMSKETTGNSVLLPPDTLAINPITWTTGEDLADKSLNLGALTNAPGKADVIVPHLYSAKVAYTGANRGQVVVCAELQGQELAEDLFGPGSLHAQDYGAYWEALHRNCYDRIAAATGKPPIVGRPTDYSIQENWLSRPVTADRGLDVFYLYPTAVPLACQALIGEIEDGMKASAQEQYMRGPSTFESYANVYAPYYRQGSMVALRADFTADGIQRFDATHVVKTDVFAALDDYFTNANPGGARPFILASHSQGSACMKTVLEEYFVEKKEAYTNNLVAAYIVGYKITPDWCERVGLKFATGETDTGVVMTWNAEGPGAASDNFLTADPNQLAINPINWKTDTTEALKADNLGSVITNAEGVLYNTDKPGVTGARLQAGRAGAVIVDDPAAIPVGVSPSFGTKSYHFEDWGFFHGNIGANGFARYAAFSGLKPVGKAGIPQVADAKWQVKVKGEDEQWKAACQNPVDGTPYAPADVQAVQLVYTLREEASPRRFVNGGTSVTFPLTYDQATGKWKPTATKAQIEAATLTGTPTLRFDTVAQRYPWDGKVDVNYKATFWPDGEKGVATIKVGKTVMTNSLTVAGTGTVMGSTSMRMPDETRGKAKCALIAGELPTDEREIEIDTRERIVINSPDQVLPIAYSTNFWGAVDAEVAMVSVSSQTVHDEVIVPLTNVNGFAEWMPAEKAYGRYKLTHGVSGRFTFQASAEICYGKDHQLTYDEDQMFFVRLSAKDRDGLGNLEDVTSYTVLRLSATPEYTNVDRYEFAGWKARSYAERDIGWKTSVEAPELAANFDDPMAAETTFEMPFTNVFLTCSYQWKSNYTDMVQVKPGVHNAWEIHEGETYLQGITTEAGSIVSARGSVNPVALTLSAGATNVWDFTNEGRPHYGDVNGFSVAAGAVNLVSFDETLTNGVYVIAHTSVAVPMNMYDYVISNGSEGERLILNSTDWTYLGGKRFKIAFDGANGDFVMTVENGGFAVSFNAQGGRHANGLEIVTNDCYVDRGYELPRVSREGYELKAWCLNWKDETTAVTNGQELAFFADHSLYAVWTSSAPTPTGGDLVIPDMSGGQPNTMIAAGAYNKDTSLTAVTTPLYLKSIGEYAFSGCTSLKSLTITASRDYDTLESQSITIARNAFSGCQSLAYLCIGSEIESLGTSAFQDCSALRRIVFGGDKAMTFGASVFRRCGYANGDGKISVYLSRAFKAANAAFIASLGTWFTDSGVEIVEKVDVAPATGVDGINVDFSQLGANRRLGVMVKTNVAGTPDIDGVDVEYTSSLSPTAWTILPAEAKTPFADGSVLVEVVVPGGNSGFVRAVVK